MLFRLLVLADRDLVKTLSEIAYNVDFLKSPSSLRPLRGLTNSTLKFMRSTCGKSTYNVIDNLDEVLLAIVFTVNNGNIFNGSRLVLKFVVSEHTAVAQYPRACGGNNKTNRILKVSILFPYLLLNTVSL